MGVFNNCSAVGSGSKIQKWLKDMLLASLSLNKIKAMVSSYYFKLHQ